jgi:hypothetical protein
MEELKPKSGAKKSVGSFNPERALSQSNKECLATYNEDILRISLISVAKSQISQVRKAKEEGHLSHEKEDQIMTKIRKAVEHFRSALESLHSKDLVYLRDHAEKFFQFEAKLTTFHKTFQSALKEELRED